ncbi:MAG: aspartate--tRNA(Asn) ligase [Nanoarchaeota archaeon]|nr:aspartate--tRNA(Asn) ligase [Nanoarchaeota archaeon]MBU4086766.1 aspartate--tRNA(Asn) ligase [Nanoarchaeota archaeon]
MERSYIRDVLKGKEEQVLVKGWVHETRALGKVRFMLVRDITGIIQIVATKDSKVFELMNQSRENVVSVSGKATRSKQAPGGMEIVPEKIEVISEAEQPLPIDVSDFSKTELPKRLDYRFLDFHRKRTQAIFRIQTELAARFREYFYNKGFIEMQMPCIISSASEGGTELFSVQYFEKKAYLAQSPQLYKQMLACSMEKTFTITPVWRAEKHNTTRHINEIRQMDIECAFMNQMEIMQELERVMKYMIEKVIENCKSELELLGVKLKVPKGVYLEYSDAIKKAGGKVGEDFTPEQEKKLCEMYPGDIVFTHSWPVSIKPFYIMPKDEKKDAKVSEGFDALYGGVEISSGGQRIHIPELLIARIKAKGLRLESFKDYVDSFRYGAVPHSGWSIGLERLTQMICGFDNVKEATMFPRDRDRITP